MLAGAGREVEAREAAAATLTVISGMVADLREPGAGVVLLGSPDVQRIRELHSG